MPKSFTITVMALAIAITTITLFNIQPSTQPNFTQKLTFEQWKNDFAKFYPSHSQDIYRFNIFLSNLLIINQHNRKYEKGQVFSTLRLNQFSDLTLQEFADIYLSKQLPQVTADFACTVKPYDKKTTFDASFYVDKAMLTEVGTQGQCASGYAFATTAAVEASMYKTIKQIVPLSAQQLVDCSNSTGNNGCTSGNPFNALHQLINKGAMKESDYPYTGKTDTCKYTSAKKVWEVTACAKTNGDIDLLKSQILQKPVIVGFDATDVSFISHKKGLYTPDKCSTTNLNHYMLAVGWGEQTTSVLEVKTTHYYIWVKNSFGKTWGDQGYGKVVVRTKSGQKDKETEGCGMMTYVVFPF